MIPNSRDIWSAGWERDPNNGLVIVHSRERDRYWYETLNHRLEICVCDWARPRVRTRTALPAVKLNHRSPAQPCAPSQASVATTHFDCDDSR